MIGRIDWQKLSDFERERAEDICVLFFSRGKKENGEWKIGDISGKAGDSLGIQLTGPNAGLWHERAGSGGGRLRKLIAQSRNLSDEAAVDEIERAFGVSFRINGSSFD
ncbi:MAG: hypothetical protein JO313_15170 [Verrucomicrobia bacterium]|nr:hypothetical protein [Verrucomicrobiota bacterium]